MKFVNQTMDVKYSLDLTTDLSDKAAKKSVYKSFYAKEGYFFRNKI